MKPKPRQARRREALLRLEAAAEDIRRARRALAGREAETQPLRLLPILDRCALCGQTYTRAEPGNCPALS